MRFLAINANDAERYPRDSTAMQRRVARGGLADAIPARLQPEVARAYGAQTTDVFVLDAGGILRYRGAPDADYDDPDSAPLAARGA